MFLIVSAIKDIVYLTAISETCLSILLSWWCTCHFARLELQKKSLCTHNWSDEWAWFTGFPCWNPALFIYAIFWYGAWGWRCECWWCRQTLRRYTSQRHLMAVLSSTFDSTDKEITLFSKRISIFLFQFYHLTHYMQVAYASGILLSIYTSAYFVICVKTTINFSSSSSLVIPSL